MIETMNNTSDVSELPVALVTGASRGIGRAIAVELARMRYHVIINYVSNEAAAMDARAEALASRTDQNVQVELCCANAAWDEGHAKLLEFTQRGFGRLDLLVNNAGIAPKKREDLLEANSEEGDYLMGVNLRGPFFLTQAVARWMIQQIAAGKAKNYRPAIVNIGSVSAYAASPERGVYCISKAGLAMMTKLFAIRLADEGINVYEIRPGVIATDMTATVKEKYDRRIEAGLTPIRRWGLPEDVALAVGAIASGKLPFSTGEVINVDGGFHLRSL